MNRRDFLRTTGLMGTVVAISSQLPETLFGNPNAKEIGLQLYTVRVQLEKDVSGTIQQVSIISYRDVEIYSL